MRRLFHLETADRRRLRGYESNTHAQRHEVDDLRRLVRIQNHLIMGGLSFCTLALLIISLVLVQHIHHPNNKRGPFWEQEKSRFGPNRQHHQQRQHIVQQSRYLHRNQNQQSKKKIYTSILTSNCSHFGCPLLPLDIARLMKDNATMSYYYPSVVSCNHMMITLKGNRPKNPQQLNRDQAVLIPSYVYSAEVRQKFLGLLIESINDPEDDFFAGVFDGHGRRGHEVAKFASEEIPSRIASKMLGNMYHDDKESSITKDMIVETFVEVDKDVPVADGGSTATVMLRVGNQLYMANTGDSTSFIVIYEPPDEFDERLTKVNKDYVSKPRGSTDDNTSEELLVLHLQGKVTIHHQNVRHKPHLPSERSRIESRGGSVSIPLDHPDDSRVMIASNNAGLRRGDDVGFSTSRSIGDREWTAVGVIPDPDVIVVDLKEFWSVHDIDPDGAKKRVFIVLGSDGLFKNRKIEYVSSHLAYGLFEHYNDENRQYDPNDQEQQQVFSRHLLEVGKKLATMASPLMNELFRDDITFIAKIVELQN